MKKLTPLSQLYLAVDYKEIYENEHERQKCERRELLVGGGIYGRLEFGFFQLVELFGQVGERRRRRSVDIYMPSPALAILDARVSLSVLTTGRPSISLTPGTREPFAVPRPMTST